MGHSMGGGEVLYYILNSSYGLPPIRGVLAYSPLVAMHKTTRPWDITVFAGKLAAKVAPHRQIYKPLDPYLMSRDKRIADELKHDELCHDTGTLEGIAGMLDRAKWLDSQKSPINSPSYEGPVWICHGTADQINSFAASRSFIDRLDCVDKTFMSYEGAYHKLHTEPDGVKEAFANDVAEWILKRCETHNRSSDSIRTHNTVEGGGKRSKSKL